VRFRLVASVAATPGQAGELSDQMFGTQAQAVDARTVHQLRARLEQLLG
jgi:hypothetical protein